MREKHIILSSGRDISVDNLTKGIAYDILHIHLHTLSREEAETVFRDPEETAAIVYQDGTNELTYQGYTELLSMEKDPFYPAEEELLIRMGKPEEDKTS